MYLLLHYKKKCKSESIFSMWQEHTCIEVHLPLFPLSTPSFHLTTKTTALKAPLHRALLNSQMFKPFSSSFPSKKLSFTAHLLKGKNQQV